MRLCLQCGAFTTNPKFCDRSCAVSFNNKLTKTKTGTPCLFCDKTCKTDFCSLQCSVDFRWIVETLPRILEGKCSAPGTLKNFLVRVNGEECSECNLGPEWNGKLLALQVDHIDGNSDNNSPWNLRLLCPNCHSQTETFGTKGFGNRYKKDTKEIST